MKPTILPERAAPPRSNLGGIGIAVPPFVPPLTLRPNPITAASGEALHLLRQLCENVDVYVRRLEVLLKLFVGPLLHDATHPKPKIVVGRASIHAAVFFTSLRDISTLEANFLDEFKAADGDVDGMCLTLENSAPLRRIYAAFVSKFDVLFEHLTSPQTAANPAFAEFLSAAASNASIDDSRSVMETTSIFVESARENLREKQVWFGASPGSKITRSKEAEAMMKHMCELLTEVMGHLESFDSSVGNIMRIYTQSRTAAPNALQGAKAAGHRTTKSVNDELTVARQRAHLQRLETVWGMALTKPGRLLLKEGYMTKMSRKSDIRYAFLLFSDVLMYGAEGTSVAGGILDTKVAHHRTMDLTHTKVVMVNKARAFQILSAKKSFEVVCDDDRDHQSWFTSIEAAISEACKKSGTANSSAAAVWKQDGDAKHCHRCGKVFTQLRRRHHCRRCGEVVCDACSKSRLPLSEFLVGSAASDKLARVCDGCVTEVQSGKAGEAKASFDDAVAVGEFDHLKVANPPASATKRHRIAHEVFSTELSYVTSLTSLVKVFVEPLLADAESRYLSIGKVCNINPDMFNMSVFLNAIKVLQTIGVEVLHAIHDRVNGWTDDMCMGDIFCQYARLFDLYAVFSEGQEIASKVIVKNIKASREFAEFVAAGEANPECRGQNLQSLLIMPIQRVLRYRMLLEEMAKDLKKKGNGDHQDAALIDDALERIKGAATAINDVIKVRENQQELLELESKWSGYECSKADRIIIKQGTLVKRCRRADKPFMFALFSDVLIYGKKETLGSVDRYVHHREIQLELSKVLSVADDAEAGEDATAFQVLSDRKAFVVMASTVEEKDAWLRAIETAIVKWQQRRGTVTQLTAIAPIWTPDRDQPSCTICKKNFTMMKRRHHCRNCGKLACQQCTSRRVLLEHISQKEVRCCEGCYEDLQANGGGGGGDDDDDDDDDDEKPPSTPTTPRRTALLAWWSTSMPSPKSSGKRAAGKFGTTPILSHQGSLTDSESDGDESDDAGE